MMLGRTKTLVAIYETYKKIHIPLVSIKNGVFGSVAACDDSGLFLYAPLLSDFFNVEVMQGAKILTISIVGIFFLLTSIGVCLLARSLWLKLAGIICLIPLCFRLSQIIDVYIAYVFVFSPLMIFIASIRKKNKRIFYFSSFLIGFIGCFSSNIRILAALPMFLFFLSMIIFPKIFTLKEKILALVLACMGYFIPYVHYEYSIYKKNIYLQDNGVVLKKEIDHSFWHNMYLGFGFTQNKYGITWEDACGGRATKAAKMQVMYGTREYEVAIRTLIFDLLRKDRHFFFTSLFARLGVVLMFFLLWFGWLGLFSFYLYPKIWYEELAFFVALGSSALPGLLTIPRFEYLCGFTVCTVLYTVYGIIYAVNKGILKNE